MAINHKNYGLYVVALVCFSAILVQSASLASVVSTRNFNKDFIVRAPPTYVNTSADGRSRSLTLDKNSASAFLSKDLFLFGQIDMRIKLVPGDSAGTIVAFYLQSSSSNRDEIDLEFLGNVSGQPYNLQTNIYSYGFGDKEERITLWFDPTKEFHMYSIFWNIYQIVITVDWCPVRVYKNHEDKGVSYPKIQPMNVIASIWNGSNWATRGGRDKIDWSKAPFVATFKDHKIDACVWQNNPRFCSTASPDHWWNYKKFNTLDSKQRRLFKWVRKYHLIYDYCQDNQRFHGNLPKECFLSKY